MTKEERINSINGFSEDTNSAPADSAAETVETSQAADVKETAPGHDETEKAVSPSATSPKESEAKGSADKGGKKAPDLYSQERANHAFAKQTKQLEAANREIASLREKLKGYEGKDRNSFVDKVSGKVDEEAYQDFKIQKAIAEDRVAQAENRRGDIEQERADAAFQERADRELGEGAGEFLDKCNEVVADDGATRIDVFTAWLEKHDPQQVVLGRIAGSSKGVRILKTLMESKDKRLEMLSQKSPYRLEQFLDRMEEGLGETAKKQSFAEAWKSHKETASKEAKKQAMKPTGSAFQGTNNNGKVVHDKKYRLGLLYK